ncbi:MAG: EamA family transporter [Pseudomonadota bacterium]|nr:EamA family transporter [Pseudomonadota bacterium]
MNETTRGVWFGLSAYTLWGCFPLFFALFEGVPAFEILVHRIVWSCVFLALVISGLRRWPAVSAALANPAQLWRVLGCALLIAANWGIYIYSVETRHVLQASLGYFLTPLVNVALAGMGILIQLVMLGELPWITLALAITFGTYGLLRKQVVLDGLSGLFVETLLLLPVGLLTFAWLGYSGASHFGDSLYTGVLLMASGIVTAIPLLLFAGAARRLRLATVGFLMYINPTLQFFIALLVFGEPLSQVQLASFVVIWLALGLYSWSSWHYRPRVPAGQN